MPIDLTPRDAISVLKELLTETQAEKAVWVISGKPGGYQCTRDDATALIEDVGTTSQPRYRLRFYEGSQDETGVAVTQTWRTGIPPADEQIVDAYLAGLYQVVSGLTYRADNPVSKFFGRPV